MAYLPEHPTLKDLQTYIDEVCKERGWVKDIYSEKFLLFTEEVGELAKAIRKTVGLYEEKARQKQVELEEEFADVLSALALDLCGFGVYTLPPGAAGALSFHDPFEGTEMEKAFREKEQVNQTRTWD